MGVAADDDSKTGCGRVKVQGIYVVNEINEPPFEFCDLCFRDMTAWSPGIDIAANDSEWRESFQQFQKPCVSDIAGMKNVITTIESGYRFLPQEAMRIRNYTDLYHLEPNTHRVRGFR
jgi:hypothetical protein